MINLLAVADLLDPEWLRSILGEYSIVCGVEILFSPAELDEKSDESPALAGLPDATLAEPVVVNGVRLGTVLLSRPLSVSYRADATASLVPGSVVPAAALETTTVGHGLRLVARTIEQRAAMVQAE